MNIDWQFERALAADALWLSTLLLACGLLAARLWHRHPARGHGVVLLSLLAAVVAPLLSQVVRSGGWGMLSETPAVATTVGSTGSTAALPRVDPEIPPLIVPEPHRRAISATDGPRSDHASSAGRTTEPRTALLTTSHRIASDAAPSDLRQTLSRSAFWLWIGLSVLALLRLFLSVAAAARLVRRSHSVADAGLSAALASAASAMRIRAVLDMRASDDVHCPSIWCWSKRPVLLIPSATGRAASSLDWESVFRHELAHLRRRDHWWAMLAEIVCCLLPWQPLTWWARRRLGRLSEQACDDWVVSEGRCAETYAQTLLRLTPQRSYAGVMSAVGGASSLRRRVSRLLRGRLGRPQAGRVWTVLACLVPAVAVAAAALAQVGPAKEISTIAADSRQEQTAQASPADFEILATEYETGLPLADVKIIAQIRTEAGTTTVEHQTNRDGIARITLPEKELRSIWVKITRTGFVSMEVLGRADDGQAMLPSKMIARMEQATMIGGFVRDENDRPIKDASIEVRLIGYVSAPPHGVPYAMAKKKVVTDSKGRWEFDLVPAKLKGRRLTYSLDHPDYLSDSLRRAHSFVFEKISMAELRGGTAVLVMKKDRTPTATVTGRVVDAEGNPIADAIVQPGWEHGHHYSRRRIDHADSVRTNADGRFRIENLRPSQIDAIHPERPFTDALLTVWARGHAPDMMLVPIVPAPEEVEFRLQAGHTFRGRVVDVDNKPIKGVRIEVEEWREARSLDWRADTDAEGRFVWDSAPGDTFLVNLRKDGYMRIGKLAATASEGGMSTTLYPILRIHGSVRDARTGKPIERFRVIPGYKRQWDIRWQDDRPREFTSGAYEYTNESGTTERGLRFESNGYKPFTSPMFQPNSGDVVLDVALEPGSGPAGVVRTPDGSPAVNAEVFLCTSGAPGSQTGFIDGRLDDSLRMSFAPIGRADAARTDADGRFSFPPQDKPAVIVVIHSSGYAELTDEELAQRSQVMLQPWGRIEGVLMVGREPGRHRMLELAMRDYRTVQWPRLSQSYVAGTDADGRFVFDRVRPGKGRLALHRIGQPYTQYDVAVEVEPGQTSRVTLGGTGRPVIGRVDVPPEFTDQVSWLSGRPRLVIVRARVPEDVESRGKDAVRAWWDARRQTAEYKARARRPASFYVNLQPDHTFRIDDVSAGKYTLRIGLWAIPPAGQSGTLDYIVSTEMEVQVPEMADGRSDEPLDLGTLMLEPVQPFFKLQVGQAAPALKLETADGKPFSLAQQLGKYVLVDFWASWCGPCVEQTPALKTLYEKFAGDKRFAMIGLSLDYTADDLERFVDQNEIKWPQSHLGRWSKTPVPGAWGVRGIPALFLIDPDGKIAAIGLTAESALSELERRLSNQ